MTQNLITSAFELVRDVEQGVLLLDTFHRLASREVPPPPPAPPRPAAPLPPSVLPDPSRLRATSSRAVPRPPPSSTARASSSLCSPSFQMAPGEGVLQLESLGGTLDPPGRGFRLSPFFLRPSSAPTTRRRWTCTCCSIASWPS